MTPSIRETRLFEPTLVAVGGVLIVATVVPLLREQAWWIRVFDFPRLQIACALALVLALHGVAVEASAWAWGLRASLALCLVYQVVRILPFTPLAKRQVQQSTVPDTGQCIRLLFANVLQTNRNAQGLVDLVREHDPDVILVLETDAWWADAVRGWSGAYPYTMLQPQDNTYGMLLYSRLPLIEPELSFLIQDDVPSIHTRVRLASGSEIHIHCLHPRPPAPQESDSSAPRDAELLIVGKAIKRNPCPVIVMGDMNDVAWSHTSDLFRAISGLLDPRVGRGFLNTFNAKHWFVRFPLDHFFHSNDFRLVSFRRLARFGSDHFPVFIHLSHEPDAQQAQPERQADAEEQQEANEKIAEAPPQRPVPAP